MSSDMRVRVAQDVLARLESNDYFAAGMCYIRSPVIDELSKNGVTDDIRNHMEEIDGGVCRVCALGGAMMSLVRLRGDVDLDDLFAFDESTKEAYLKTTTLRHVLTEVFTENQLALIETAYEGTSVLCFYGGLDDDLDRARAFGRNHTHGFYRMKAIWRNVVENDGVFTP